MIDILNRYTKAVLYHSETADSIGVAVLEAYKSRANLSRANLSGADLSGAYLSRADLSVARDPQYRAFLRTEGHCVPCMVMPVKEPHRQIWTREIDPAHGKPNGKGSKGSDYDCIPLCRLHHDEQTRLGWDKFCVKYGMDIERERQVWQALYAIWKEHETWPVPKS